MKDCKKSEDPAFAEIKFFTLELSEAETREDICFFCHWQDDDHLNLGEMNNKSHTGDFALAIKQQNDPT